MPKFKAQTIEAIVLNARDFEESDRLVTLFTKQYGRITAIAKGVRRITSRRGGNIDVLNNVVVTMVQGQSLRLITEANVVDSYLPLKENLQKAFYAYYIVELVNSLTVEEQEHPDVYYLLRETLSQFAENAKRIHILAFEIKLLTRLGFWSFDDIAAKSEQLLALAKKIQVTALKQLGSRTADDHDVIALEHIVRRKLADIAEHEFKSPQIMAKLRDSIKMMEEQKG